MTIRKRKEIALDEILTAYEKFTGRETAAELTEYRRFLITALARSERIRVKLHPDKLKPITHRPMADFDWSSLKLD